jgi:hypothetical protein
MFAAKRCPVAALQQPSVQRLLRIEQSLEITMSQALLASLHCRDWHGLVELHTRVRGLRQWAVWVVNIMSSCHSGSQCLLVSKRTLGDRG